jgi:hypothetical protein
VGQRRVLQLPLAFMVYAFPYSERLRITDPVGVTKTPFGKNSLAIASGSFLFHAEIKLSTIFDNKLRSSELTASSGLLLSAAADPEIKRKKIASINRMKR